MKGLKCFSHVCIWPIPPESSPPIIRPTHGRPGNTSLLLLPLLLSRASALFTVLHFPLSCGLAWILSILTLDLLSACLYKYLLCLLLQPQQILVLPLRASELCRAQFPSFPSFYSVPHPRAPLETLDRRLPSLGGPLFEVTSPAKACTTGSARLHASLNPLGLFGQCPNAQRKSNSSPTVIY
ncbi:hypothetical protein EDB83DRAFT_908122 [Lactarius deliciosus]|nr:hypothetical protein EDB83DRAFT_908122 [Lactarius deliciosus]